MTAEPNAYRKLSAKGLSFIKRWEGLYLKAYFCPANVLTIGYGHTNLSGVHPKVYVGMTLKDEAAAASLLNNVLAEVYEPILHRHVKVALTQGQWDAMVSWVYNLGETNFRQSTLLKRINAGRLDAVPAEIMKWNRATGRVLRGLTNRRRDECALWRSIRTDDTHTEPVSLPQGGFDQPEPEPLTENDKWIERLGVLGPVLVSLVGGLTDWRTATAMCVTAVVLVVFFAYRNRSED